MRAPRYLVAALPLLAALLLAACGTAPVTTPARKPAPKPSIQEPTIPQLPPANSGRGAYYQDDGPGDNPPPGLLNVPDAEVRNDPPLPRSNRPYVVFGKTYTPIAPDQPFSQRGQGTWYGKKFHGQRTSSGEIYDMYKMTAAHPTLPIPSYARVTNLANDKSVIVRINDRGPFHSARVIDVSYTAALKLGLLVNGSSQLEVVHLLPSEIAQMMAARKAGQPAPEPAATATTQAPPALPKAAPMLASSDADKDAAAVLLAGGGSASATPTVGQAADVAAGFYLQVGAYSHANSAETLRGTLAEACSGDKFEVVKAGNVFRIFGGPHATRQDAADAIKRIPSSLRLKPIIIQR